MMMSDSVFCQERISNAHFMVVGCGALGNEVLKDLVLFGARHLVLVDFDHVEMGNLTRSVLFSRNDAQMHRRKVDAAAERLRAMNPEVEILTLYGDIAQEVGLGYVRRMDVVIGCVDNRWARYCINRLCMRANIPWVDGGIDLLEGTARVFRPGENCYACNLGPEGLKSLKFRRSCSGIIRQQEEQGHAPTTPITASIIAAVQVQEALKLIHREALAKGDFTSLCGRMFYYEGQHLSTRYLDFRAYDDDCPVHTVWAPIRSVAINCHHRVNEALDYLKKEFDGVPVAIELVDDCFVDFVAHRSTDEEVQVMRPGRQVAAYLQKLFPHNKELFEQYYQHEYRMIDSSFPYQEITLAQLGLPAWSVVPVTVGNQSFYIELEEHFS
jgi:adenylyltransferase/sulfurtransferase